MEISRFRNSQSSHDAAQALGRAAENGELSILACPKKSVDHKTFDQHFWRNAYFHINQSNSASIWEASIKAKPDANIQIPEYDAPFVEKASVETLWRRRDWRYDCPALWINIVAAWKRMTSQRPDVDRPQRQAQEPKAPTEEESPKANVALAGSTTIGAAGSANPKAEILPTSSAPNNWDRLFAIGDDGQSVWLKFLPDTKKYKADALLLIAYGYKVLLDVPKVSVRTAHAAVDKTVSNAPNRPAQPFGLLLGPIAHLQGNNDYADEHVPHHMERIDLSQGGRYRLTEAGEQQAKAMAHDFIRRIGGVP